MVGLTAGFLPSSSILPSTTTTSSRASAALHFSSSSRRRSAATPLRAKKKKKAGGGGGGGGGGDSDSAGDAAQRKKRVRKKVKPGPTGVRDGEAVEIAEVEDLIRSRKVSRLGGAIDVDQFIADEDLGGGRESLPDLGDVPAFDSRKREAARAAASMEEGGQVDGSGGGGGGGGGIPKLLNDLFYGAKGVLAPEPTNVKYSDDYFDQGFGLVFKNFVYFLSAAAVVWEIYISFFMARQLPVQSVEQALVGYGNAIDGSKPEGALNPAEKLFDDALKPKESPTTTTTTTPSNLDGSSSSSAGGGVPGGGGGGVFPEINVDPLSQ